MENVLTEIQNALHQFESSIKAKATNKKGLYLNAAKKRLEQLALLTILTGMFVGYQKQITDHLIAKTSIEVSSECIEN